MTNEYQICVQMIPYDGCDCGDDIMFSLDFISDLDYDSFMAQLQEKMEDQESTKEKLRLVIEYLKDQPRVHRHILEMIGEWDE